MKKNIAIVMTTIAALCTGLLSASASSWPEPQTALVPFAGLAASTDEQNNPVTIGGCSKLSFNPSLELTPETAATATPTGLEANLRNARRLLSR